MHQNFPKFVCLHLSVKTCRNWTKTAPEFANPEPVGTEKRLAFATITEPGQSALLCNLTIPCIVCRSNTNSCFDIQKMDSFKYGKWTSLYKKFSWKNVNE